MQFNKHFLFFLFIILSLFYIFGCAQVVPSLDAYSERGRISNPQTYISGIASYDAVSKTVTLTLNPIIINGAIKTLNASQILVYGGEKLGEVETWQKLKISSVAANKYLDLVLVLENRGDMHSRITAIKDSIESIKASLEAASISPLFGGVAFGEYFTVQPTMEGYTTEAKTIDLTNPLNITLWLESLPSFEARDVAANPIDAIKYAYNSFVWRDEAQKQILLITNTYSHQANSPSTEANYPAGDATLSPVTSYLLSGEAANLRDKAIVHVISPKYASLPAGGYADAKQFADSTGGKWIEIPSAGNIDLISLGIVDILKSGYTLTAISDLAGYTTYYLHVVADTDGDGIGDADGILTLSL